MDTYDTPQFQSAEKVRVDKQTREVVIPIHADQVAVRLGRSSECEVELIHYEYPQISRYHALILGNTKGFCVIDKDSKNGTSINFQRLSSNFAYSLNDGDVLGLADIFYTVRIIQRDDCNQLVLRDLRFEPLVTISSTVVTEEN